MVGIVGLLQVTLLDFDPRAQTLLRNIGVKLTALSLPSFWMSYSTALLSLENNASHFCHNGRYPIKKGTTLNQSCSLRRELDLNIQR